MTNPVRQIHRFFAKHGSPVARFAPLFVKASRRNGINPFQLAAHVMAETEGGLTGTGRPGSGYNLTGMGGVGNMRTYRNWQESIIDSAKNLASPRYKGKSLAQQTAMWVAGGPPSATTQPYTNTIFKYMKSMGGKPEYSTYKSGGGNTRRRKQGKISTGMGGIQPIGNQMGGLLGTLLGQMSGNPELSNALALLGQAGQVQKQGGYFGAMGAGMGGGRGGKKVTVVPDTLAGQPEKIFKLLRATQIVSKRSAGYSKATSRGPLKSVSVKSALDCSLSVAKVLQMAGLGYGPNQSAPVSGDMAKNWGKPGKGKHLTMYASDGHVFLEFKIKGKFYRFDTSHHTGNQPRGPRLMRTRRGDEANYVARHWPGL